MKTTFLHGNLNKVVDMSQPEGHIKPEKENKICKINKPINDLKQAARVWNIKISNSLKKLSFVQNTDDPCLLRQPKKENMLYITVYVYDLLTSGEDRGINNITENL